MNSKALLFIVALSIKTSSTFGANLRGSKDDNYYYSEYYSSGEKKSNLSQVVPEDAVPPSISLDKTDFEEGEPIVVSFSAGSPSDPYYSAVPTRLDFDFRGWSVGLFMRDADPQGGSNPPIVSINFCSVVDCVAGSNNYLDFSGTVTFGSSDFMQGSWPIQVADYGTGFDAWVLDSYGAAAIGPFEFYIQDEYSANVNTNLSQKTTAAAEDKGLKKHMAHESHPLAKYGKGATKTSAHGSTKVTHSASNSKLLEASGLQSSGLEMSQAKVTSEDAITLQNEEEGFTEGTISSDKEAYEDDEEVALTVSVNSKTSDYTGWRVGIFMRMANPQGGALPPIISLPLCPEPGCIIDSKGSVNTTIVFGMNTLNMTQWPMDLFTYGTGFDAYILDEQGNGVLGPAKFNILMPGDR